MDLLALAISLTGLLSYGSISGMQLVDTRLHKACENSELIPYIKKLLRDGANPNSADESGQTPLCIASKNNHPAIVTLLLEVGANRSSATESGRNPLHLAAQNGHLQIVEILLDECEPKYINSIDRFKFTPIHLAASSGYEDVVQLLIARGAAINLENKSKQLPLHLAAQKGHLQIIETLLIACESKHVNRIDRFGMTPLHLAASGGHKDAVENLLAYNASIGVKDKDGKLPLHLAISNGHKNVVELLLDADVNGSTFFASATFNTAPEGQFTPLELAKGLAEAHEAQDQFQAIYNYLYKSRLFKAAACGLLTEEDLLDEPMPLLAAAPADHDPHYTVDTPDNNLMTPLHHAARTGKKDTVALLLAHHADINVLNDEQMTPLHFASINGHADVVKFLLENGAYIHALDQYQKTPLYCAAINGHADVVQIMLDSRASETERYDSNFEIQARTLVFTAIKAGHLEVVEVLICNYEIFTKYPTIILPAKFNFETGTVMYTPLEYAEYLLEKHNQDPKKLERYQEIRDWLKRALDDLDLNKPDHGGRTLLHNAVRSNELEVAKLLLDNGANVNAPDSDGKTPLFFAVTYNSGNKDGIELIRLLLRKGAQSNESSVLFDALEAKANRLQIFDLLLKAGADPNVQYYGPIRNWHGEHHFT